MNVLMIIDGLGAGGVERRMISLIKYLIKTKGMYVEVIVLSTHVHYDCGELENVTFHFIKRWPKKDIRVFYKIYFICQSFHPDILHVWGSQPAMYAIPASLVLKIKIVNSMINDAPQVLPLKQRIRSGITFPFSSAVIANSHAGINVYKPQSSKAHVIYNGFDFDRIKNLTPAEILKKKYGIPENQFVVGMVARFEKHKDYETFLSAASRILKQGKDAIFLLVGDGRQLPVYESVYSKGFDDRIRFLGRQQNVEEIISIFDIGVLATFTEGISNSVMEYMALKKPVVVTDCPGNREIVVHGKTGFVVPVKNPDRLAEKISELLIDGRLREQCGEAGYKRIVENFTIGIMAEGFLNIYRNIINGKEQIH